MFETSQNILNNQLSKILEDRNLNCDMAVNLDHINALTELFLKFSSLKVYCFKKHFNIVTSVLVDVEACITKH